MIKSYKKGASFQLSKNFSSKEFDCQCKYPECDTTSIDEDLIIALEKLRKKVKPIHITSGYRCTRHNKDVGGKVGSYHLVGKAADIYVEGLGISSLYYYVVDIPEFKKGGVGVYSTFLHCDVRGTASRWNG